MFMIRATKLYDVLAFSNNLKAFYSGQGGKHLNEFCYFSSQMCVQTLYRLKTERWRG